MDATPSKNGNRIIHLPSSVSTTASSSTDTPINPLSPSSVANETVIMPSGNPFLIPIRSLLSSGGGDGDADDDGIGTASRGSEKGLLPQMKTLSNFLSSLGLDNLIDIFEREQITLEILAEMAHEDLKGIGISAYGHRHLIVKGIDKWRTTMGGGTMLIELGREDREFLAVEEEMQATIRNHKDNGHAGGIFSRYNIIKVS